MSSIPVRPSAAFRQAPDPGIDRALRNLVLTGLVLVLLVPLARVNTTWLGWLPMWLVGMPAVAWWALHRFRLPRWPAAARSAAARRRRLPQARRRAGHARTALLRAA